jgi:hypothetical protein
VKYWIDTEFIEYPCTIDLISIGIVAEDGREFYAVSSEFDRSTADSWVRENVLAGIDKSSVSPITRRQIKDSLLRFVGNDTPEFWGYYADYDWVALCWLFGKMIDLPKGWPMYCRDIKQWCDQVGNPKLPLDAKNEHNALSDARWNREAWEFLMRRDNAKNIHKRTR